MTPTVHTSLLIIGMVVSFAVGTYVERHANPQPIPNQLPSNFDPAACVLGEKSARQEAAAYQALLTKVVDGCRAPAQETH